MPQPKGDLLAQKNPTCFLSTYVAGQVCCRDGQHLLDADQEIPAGVQEYRFKARFYFEEYATSPKPSHMNLARIYWQTETFAGEYDVVPCLPGTPPESCVHTITSRWQVRDMLKDCPVGGSDHWCTGIGSTDAKQTAGIKLIYAGPHCHAPSCLSMELYNADTGRLLCSMQPIKGTSDEPFDERGFHALPPCLWGEPEDGLMATELLSLDTSLLSIKRNNNTYVHYAEMASWQMRGVVVPREPKLQTKAQTWAELRRWHQPSKHKHKQEQADKDKDDFWV